jgi:hypothetical protein
MTTSVQAPTSTVRAPSVEARRVGTAYKWFIWLSGFGAHQFYLGRPGAALLRIFTLNALGILFITDSLTLDQQVDRVNARLGY